MVTKGHKCLKEVTNLIISTLQNKNKFALIN